MEQRKLLMQVPDEAIALRFLDNSFVRSIKKVWVSPDSVCPVTKTERTGEESVEKAG